MRAMTTTPAPTKEVHASVRTSTSLNVDDSGRQWLRVTTTRLVLAWRGAHIAVGFTCSCVLTEVGSPAAKSALRPRRGAR
jgi:hypothetical protein